MKHLGTVATKKFNALQNRIKSLCDEMTASLDNTEWETYSDRLIKKINPELDLLLLERDKYLI